MARAIRNGVIALFFAIFFAAVILIFRIVSFHCKYTLRILPQLPQSEDYSLLESHIHL
jgi:hypothetical protein